jgi:hypothetical protein
MRTLVVGFTVACFAHVASAAEPTKAQAEFFESKVRPVLVEYCYHCHSVEAKKDKGGLVVDSLQGLLDGGDGGPAIVPGQPEKSRLILAISLKDPDLRMPPKAIMPPEAIAALTAWIKDGAPWPSATATAAKRSPGKITDEDRQWWAFQPMKKVEPPAAGDGWAVNEIDRFIAAKLKTAGLTPAPEASRAALIRRVTFDLIGLPPTLAQVDEFVNDSSPNAYEKLVGRLLASPQYGERWARHWLDLVRYADSDGYRIDDYRPQAWRYRDYVIRAFNADKPYSRFVAEQLAGDELFPTDADAQIATGYLRHWIYEYNARDVRGQWSVILNDITDTTGDVFLGLGMQCARCHDHKFDPILQKDYYRLQAYFANILPIDDKIVATDAERAEHAAKKKLWEAKTADIRAEIERIEAPYRKKAAESAINKFPLDIQAMIRKSADRREPLEHQLAELAYRQVDYEFERLERTLSPADKEKVIELRRRLVEFEAMKPAPLPTALTIADVGPAAPAVTIPKRAADPIAPGSPTILSAEPATIVSLATAPESTGRRAALAKWLTEPANPLTARVMVNRIWQQHFGRGLAANASDFGRLGEPPTHPELLDWLAAKFVRDGWSMKGLHRRMVLSAAYRQSATHPDAAAGKLKDPENRLLWRGGVRRLDAEQIRDALFAATDELDLRAGGPGSPGSDPRRSIYMKIMRNNRDPILDGFDAPLWFSSASSRDTTTTPVQSLMLINSQFLLRRAQALAARIEKSEADPAKRLALAYRLAFGREPTSEEAAAATRFLAEQARRIDPNRAVASEASFTPGKIPYRDGQAAELKLDAVAFQVPHGSVIPTKDFTIEAFVFPRSVSETGAVRTIAAKWSGNVKDQGWAFGITGQKSRRKPQTLVMQMFGEKRDGGFGEEAIFADLHVQLNKPYYLAASIKLSDGKKPGLATFYLKDLSNDDEPLLVAKVEHDVIGSLANTAPLSLGCRAKNANGFDGLLDDVRLSETAIGVDQLLFTHEGINKNTVGYWQFEAKPNVFRDASGHGLDIQATQANASGTSNPGKSAWVDLCHALLNASEFLYVE